MVTFVTEGPPCSCGLRPRGIEVAQVRVNRRSLRTVGNTIGAMPRMCRECRAPGGDYVLRRWLDRPDAVKVGVLHTAAGFRWWCACRCHPDVPEPPRGTAHHRAWTLWRAAR